MATTNYDKLTKMQIDALKEVGNIGAGHAATALSNIVGKTIMVSVSKFEIISLADAFKTIGQSQDEVIAVHMKLLGNVLGGIILVFRKEEGLKLAKIFAGDKEERVLEFSKAVESSLKEAGSILTAAYLSSIGGMMHFSLIPSIPKIVDGSLRKTLDDIFSEISQRAETAFCIETAFVESSINLNGYFLLVPQVNSLDVMLKSLGVANL